MGCLVPLWERAQEALPLRLHGAPLVLRGARRDVGGREAERDVALGQEVEVTAEEAKPLGGEITDVLHVSAHHVLEHAELRAGVLEVVYVTAGPVVIAPLAAC